MPIDPKFAPATKGSILVSTTGGWEVIAPGANDQALCADSTQPSGLGWMSVGGGAGMIVSVTADYTVTSTDGTIIANATAGPITITLPSPSVSGMPFTIKKNDSSANVVTVAGTIDGATNYLLEYPDEFVTVESDNTQFWVTAE